jgi:hypothetical protein
MPDEQTKPQTISEYVRGTLRRAIADALHDVRLPGADAWYEAQRRYYDDIEAALIPLLRKAVPEKLWDQQGLETVKQIWQEMTQPKGFAWGSIASGIISDVVSSPIGAVLYIWGEIAKQNLLEDHPITIPEPGVLIRAAYAEPHHMRLIDEWWRKLGVGNIAGHMITEAMREHLPPELLQALVLEKAWTEKDAAKELAWTGYDPQHIPDVLWYYLDRADITDMIRAWWRGKLKWSAVLIEAHKRGWTDEMAHAIAETMRPIYTPDMAMTAWWRHLLSWDQAVWHLQAAGYPPESYTVIQEALRPRLTPPTLIEAYYRRYITITGYLQYMQELGYRPIDAMIQLWASTQLLSPSDIQVLWYRHRGYGQDWGTLLRMLSYLPIEEQRSIYSTLDQLDPQARAQLTAPQTWMDLEHDDMLLQQGYTQQQVEMIRSLYPYIPSVPDLVRMAVRDTWNEPIVRKYGYDEDFPAAYVYWCLKQGLTPEWALRYWRAHWELPSPTMGYEMYQRGIITRQELEELLRIADYPRYWRDKMIEIAYTPITRVDIRRLYQTGVIKTHEELVKRYKDIGYSPENAELLAKFTEKMYSTKEKDLTRADVLGLYADGILDASEAKDELLKMGYDEDEAELLVERQTLRLIKQARANELARVKEEYLKGLKPEPQIMSELISMGYTTAEVARYMRRWATDRAKAAPVPSVDDLIRFRQHGVITDDQLRTELANRHVPNKYIEWWAKYAAATATGGARYARH